MASTRRAIIDAITTRFRTYYNSDNVTNKFRTVSELLDMTATTKDKTFPWFNVAIGIHNAVLDLSGTLEIERSVPVVVVAYDVASSEVNADDLQLVLADLADKVVDTITKQAAVDAFCTAGFGVENIQLFPAEDEEHYEIAILTARINTVSGD